MAENKHNDNVDFSNLNHMLEETVALSPDSISYQHIVDENTILSLTRGELLDNVKKLASLIAQRVDVGDRVILAAEPGLEFVIGFFAIVRCGAIAVPVFPPANEAMTSRFVHVLNDCNPSLILWNQHIESKIKTAHIANDWLPGKIKKLIGIKQNLSTLLDLLKLQDIAILTTEQRHRVKDVHHDSYEASPEDIVFLQYTSGSTSDPRGVMITHRNILANLHYIKAGGNLDASYKMLSWVPPYHDMGLIFGILEPLYCGFISILMSPIDFLMKPSRWVEYITKYKITISLGTNFAYDLCANKTDEATLKTLDLSSMRYFISGGEPISARTIQLFEKKFKKVGLKENAVAPCYGMAEATLAVAGETGANTYLDVDAIALSKHIIKPCPIRDNQITLTSCGKPFVPIKIVSIEGEQLCDDDQIGEIWISGPCIAKGYYGHKQKSDEVFGATLPGQAKGAYMRSGDLGFMHDGQLFICGRIKHLVILNGQNYYPNDIEYYVSEAHPSIRKGCVVAYSETSDFGERLQILAELKRGCQTEEFDKIASAITSHLAKSLKIAPQGIYLLAANSIPKTTSGKLQRNLAADLNQKRQLNYLYKKVVSESAIPSESNDAVEINTMTNLQQQSSKVQEDVLRRFIIDTIKQKNPSVTLDKPIDETKLNSLGIDSIMAVELCVAFEATLPKHISVEPDIFYSDTTIRDLAKIFYEKINAQDEAPANIDADTSKDIADSSPAWIAQLIRLVKGRSRFGEVLRSLLGVNQFEQLLSYCADYEFFPKYIETKGLKADCHYQFNLNQIKDGPLIIIANHATPFDEAILILETLLNYRTDIKVFVNELVDEVLGDNDIYLPVNVFNKKAATNAKSIMKADAWLKQGHAVMLFPSGSASQYQFASKRWKDYPWSPYFLTARDATNATILPVEVKFKSNWKQKWVSKLPLTLRRVFVCRIISLFSQTQFDLTFHKAIQANEPLSLDEAYNICDKGER